MSELRYDNHRFGIQSNQTAAAHRTTQRYATKALVDNRSVRNNQATSVLRDNRALPLQRMVGALQDNRRSSTRVMQYQTRQHSPTGLPDALRSGMESVTGISLGHVKVHYNSSQPQAVQAHAFARGDEIHLAPGQEKHLPHELGHIVQQARGEVKPTMQLKGGDLVNTDTQLEKDADELGNKAMAYKGATTQPKSVGGRQPAVVQRRSSIEYDTPLFFGYDWPAVALGPAPAALLNMADMGSSATAHLDVNDPKQGSGPTGAADQVHARQDTQFKHGGAWVLGHLINDDLGGLGIPANLYPITNEANMEHYHAVERKVKNLLYRQPLAGNFALAADGYLEYQVDVVPQAAATDSETPQVNFQCRWRTQQNQPGPAPVVAPIWNPWQNYTVRSRTNDHVAVPAAWASSGNNLRPAGLIPVTSVALAGYGAATAAAAAAGIAVPVWHAGATAALIQNSGTANAQVIGWAL